ncbi:MAG: L-threonylcarbamoyladenylate synthase [Ardenticatenaceae bacterium]|nr:L-threonylcarbamoyladenylate synthase [Ardenticatenaceae bacterium]
MIRAAIRSVTELNALDQALALLKTGEAIALPTDTVYGVAVDCANAAAMARLYEIKERPRDRPIPLLLANESDLLRVATDVPATVWELARAFWPGGLTLVVPAAGWLPEVLTAGQPSVAVRLPDHRVPRVLAAGLGRPLAATSANLSGHPSARTADEVFAQLNNRVPLILDGGGTPGGLDSTIVDLTTTPFRILREGPITRDQLAPWLERDA